MLSPPCAPAQLAIEALYANHRATLLAYLTRLVRDYAAAEDLCQETFLKALRSWGGQGAILNEQAWLYRIATNTAYDHLRRRRRLHFAPLYDGEEGALGPAESMEQRLDAQEPVRQALAQLPADARRLLLSSYHGVTTQELAASLACSDAAVRLRLFRARARFRKAYLALGRTYSGEHNH